MESEDLSPLPNGAIKCCECGCTCSVMNRSLSGTYIRTVKRKLDEFEEVNQFTIPGFVLPQNARVEIGNECAMLREMVSNQQQTTQELMMELEEERNASASATNEAMSMILRLQREKAEIQMELRQFKRYAEEKMAHDQQETVALDDLLYKREQTIQSLTCEVQAYKHRMMSYGLIGGSDGERGMSRNSSMTENLDGQFEFPPYEIYPPLRCNTIASHAYADDDNDYDYEEETDTEQYAFGETPRNKERLKDLENRINQLEKSPRVIKPDGELNSAKSVFEKVIVDQSPRCSKHLRKFSTDSLNSVSANRDTGTDLATDSANFGNSFKKTESVSLENSNLKEVDNVSGSGDDTSDRVYTIDSVHQGASVNDVMDPKASVRIGHDESPRESIEIQKLYARLHALEADRESMRQAIVSIGTDKAQLVLLKEIAQNLCKEMSPAKQMPVKKQPSVRSFSCFAVFKWILSFVLWRRKAMRSKYMFGLSENNAGLLMLLDRGPRIGHWRYIKSANVRAL